MVESGRGKAGGIGWIGGAGGASCIYGSAGVTFVVLVGSVFGGSGGSDGRLLDGGRLRDDRQAGYGNELWRKDEKWLEAN